MQTPADDRPTLPVPASWSPAQAWEQARLRNALAASKPRAPRVPADDRPTLAPPAPSPVWSDLERGREAA